MTISCDELNRLAQMLAEDLREVPGYLTDREARHLVMLMAFAGGGRGA